MQHAMVNYPLTSLKHTGQWINLVKVLVWFQIFMNMH